MDDDELLEALGVDPAPIKAGSRTPREERIVAGFEDILRFHEQHGRAPLHGEGRDIFERLYAVRLDQLRKLPEAAGLLVNLDTPGLLRGSVGGSTAIDELDEDALLVELGVGTESEDERHDPNDITVLRHVRSTVDKRAADEIANRVRCTDFDQFAPLFERVKAELASGVRQVRAFKTRALHEIQARSFFIVGGQIAYVVELGDEFTTKYERRDSRLRVVFDNGTESDVLQRSLQRALHRDELARLITEPAAGPLFGDVAEPDDIESGTIYVLRSRSDHPYIAEHRELIHKIGVTGGEVEARVAGASKDATYLLAEVDVVATYRLHNLNRVKLENLFHRLFGSAQLDLTLQDRFGRPVKPREWFMLPLHVIDEAVARVRDGSIAQMHYDRATARLIPSVSGKSSAA